MAVAHLVPERCKTVHDHHEPTNDVPESVVKVWAFVVHSKQLRHLLELLGQIALVVPARASKSNLKLREDGLKQRARRGYGTFKIRRSKARVAFGRKL